MSISSYINVMTQFDARAVTIILPLAEIKWTGDLLRS